MTAAQRRVTSAGLAHGEWIKLRSVRSTRITLGLAFVATILLGVLFSMSAGGDNAPPGPIPGAHDPVSISLSGTTLTQLLVGIVGVLIVAGEYSTGLIRTLLGAVGTRLGVLRAKASVIAVTIFVIMSVATTLALVAGQAVYNGSDATVSLADDGVIRVLLGATLYLTGVAVIGVALGFIFRSTAGAIGVLVAFVFIVPNLIELLPTSISDRAGKYLPSKLGGSMMALYPDSDQVAVGPAFALFAVWVIALLVLAAVLLDRRDV